MLNTLRAAFGQPAFVLALAAGAFAIAAPFYFASTADQAAERREEGQVANGLDQIVEEIATRSIAETVWDEAVVNLDHGFDPQWAEDYIGSFFYAAKGYEASLVADASDRMIYASRDGVTVAPSDLAALEEAAASRIAEVRAIEDGAPPLAERVARGETLSQPIQATGFSQVGSDVYLLTATLVQPDLGSVMPAAERSPIVVTADLVDEGFAHAMGERYLLEGVRYLPGDSSPGPRRSSILLRDDHGFVLARLEWKALEPGATLLAWALPPTFIVLLALSGLAMSLFHRQQRATRSLVASEARATQLAYHDALTGLPNRLLLADRLTLSIASLRNQGVPFAVHCIDLDGFKDVNDTFGHAVGDDVILQTARVLANACGPADTLARLGGDEFAILQADAAPETVSAFAHRLVDTLQQVIEVDSAARIHVGGSVGVSFITDHAVSPQECLRQSDVALYRAKDAGRGRHALYEAEIDAALRARRALQQDLREALALDALHVVYQPQVDGTGRMFGVETLVRWQHPVLGSTSPSVFVPLAEESGLIEDLGFLTLRRAFEDSARWPGLKVAVNVSAIQLRLKGFTARLADLVSEHGVDTSRFELEITEGLLLGDDKGTHETLEELRRMGFRIALDDFGTGYSSLSYLRRYPIDKIKIDRSFVVSLDLDKRADAVVFAIVRLARALGLAVIAEGVETEAQRRRLFDAGCSDVQGFLYGKPVRPEEITALVTLDRRLQPSRAA